jgi:hypothetical protein
MRTKAKATLVGFFLLAASGSVLSQAKAQAPTLTETLEWLRGASNKESSDGNTHITFESDDKTCAATITETRVKAGPEFWIRMSFSLADIDPADIQVEDLAKGELKKSFEGQSSVRFHTTNYRDRIIHTSNNFSKAIPASDYVVFTNDWFAPRFARAFKRAVVLCGGKPSSF